MTGCTAQLQGCLGFNKHLFGIRSLLVFYLLPRQRRCMVSLIFSSRREGENTAKGYGRRVSLSSLFFFSPLTSLAGWSLARGLARGKVQELRQRWDKLPWIALKGDSFFAVNKQPTLLAWSISSLLCILNPQGQFHIIVYPHSSSVQLSFSLSLSLTYSLFIPPTLGHDTLAQTLSSSLHRHTNAPKPSLNTSDQRG